MDKDRVAKWQERIEETFKGKSGLVGGDHLQDLMDHEKRMRPHLIKVFYGYVRLMDAFFDFYIETHRQIAARQETKWPDNTVVLSLMHLATLWRFRTSYIVFWKGYFVDAHSLLRAVLENVFQIAALHSGTITIREMFGDGSIRNAKNLSVEQTDKLIQQRVSACDRKVRSWMIGDQSGLTSDAKEDLRMFVQGLHMSVHKAQATLLLGFKKWVDRHPLSFFPAYDEGLATLYANSSVFLGWMVTKTFPLLQIKSSEFADSWQEKYKVLDESFQEYVADFPKRLGRSVEELIQKKFDFEQLKNV